MNQFYTAESVTEGHPDKLCDLIADSVLDECLSHDALSRVACEVLATKGQIIVAGEITSLFEPDITQIAHSVLRKVGYDPARFAVQCLIHKQSLDIAAGVDCSLERRRKLGGNHPALQLGAGDQGVMVGYACSETPQMMPLPIVLAHRLTGALTFARKSGMIQGLHPDGKAQVTVEYDEDGKPLRLDTIVLSAQHSLKKNSDELYAVTGLSGFDRRQVCVPKFCEKSCQQRSLCRYHQYLKEAKSAEISIQICNHNYLLADAAHRLQALHPLLNDYQALVIDEAHKLPDAARQMYGQSLSAEDFREICDLLAKEKHILAAQQLNEKFSALMRSMCRDEPPEEDRRTAFVLTPDRITALRDCLFLLRQTQKQLAPYLPRWISYRLGAAENILNLFFTMDRKYILYIQYDRAGAPSLCAASREIPKQLNQALWLKNIPAILTSGTLMAGGSFDRPQKIMGLSENQRVENFIAASPFNYEENCLLYIPDSPLNVQIGSEKEVEYLAEQICRLVEAAHGHTLVLFTSYALMGAVYNQIKDRLSFPLMEVWRHSSDVIHKFKQTNNAVLFAAGSCWEGVDFPGDMVSSLIIVRLPFPVPDPLSEAEREQYPSLQDYIRSVIIPDMQVKLRQGFGRAIRTENDTCAISILDHRAAPGERHHQAVLEALPNLRITRKIKEVEEFIRAKKSSDYFLS